MKKYVKPQAYVAETKDHRFAGTFEVLVPVPDRVKPQRIAQQFPTQQAAEGWLHSDEGQDAIAELFAAHKPKPVKEGPVAKGASGKAAKPAKPTKPAKR